MSVHQEGPECTGCEAKGKTALPYLFEWFKAKKRANPRLHISCASRGFDDQEAAFNSGASKLRWPWSAHNRRKPNGEPESWALDLFEIIDGKAVYSPRTFATLNEENVASGEPLMWGGNFKSLGDACHFEYNPKVGG